MNVATLAICAWSRHQECLACIVHVNVCADGIGIDFFLFLVAFLACTGYYHLGAFFLPTWPRTRSIVTQRCRAHRTANSICKRDSIHFPYKNHPLCICALFMMCILHFSWHVQNNWNGWQLICQVLRRELYNWLRRTSRSSWREYSVFIVGGHRRPRHTFRIETK